MATFFGSAFLVEKQGSARLDISQDVSLCCVSLSQLLKLSGLQGPLLQEGLGNPSPPGFSIRKKMERVCLENCKTLAGGFGTPHSLPSV